MHTIHDTPRTTFIERITNSTNRTRIAAGLAGLVAMAGLATGLGLATAGGDTSAAPAAGPITSVAQTDVDGPGQPPSSSSDGGIVTGTDSPNPLPGTGGDSNPSPNPNPNPNPAPQPGNDSDPSDPQPEPTPTPANQGPTITDVEVETSGLTVIVRYRVEDPDGDDVTTDVTFRGPVRTDLEAPQQGPVAIESARSSSPRIPTAPADPGKVIEDRTPDGPTLPDSPTLPDTAIDDGPDKTADEGHGPELGADGRFEASHTFDRDTTGADFTARITIEASDEHGAETKETARAEVEAIDMISLSDVSYRIPDTACFQATKARRLYGNIDLVGAIDSRNALDDEFRADRSQRTILGAQTVEAEPGQGLTVSFQPAMEGMQLTNHVVTHTESAVVEARIGSGDCAGILTYRVVVSAG